MKPATPRTATRANLRWSGTAKRPTEAGYFGGRPYDWEARAALFLESGFSNLEVQFLTQRGWGRWRKVRP